MKKILPLLAMAMIAISFTGCASDQENNRRPQVWQPQPPPLQQQYYVAPAAPQCCPAPVVLVPDPCCPGQYVPAQPATVQPPVRWYQAPSHNHTAPQGYYNQGSGGGIYQSDGRNGGSYNSGGSSAGVSDGGRRR
jgi:hypothetical protein